jgi:hypothetical protein
MTLSAYQIVLIEDALKLLAARWAHLGPAGDDAELAELLAAITECADIYIAHAPRPYTRMPE